MVAEGSDNGSRDFSDREICAAPRPMKGILQRPPHNSFFLNRLFCPAEWGGCHLGPFVGLFGGLSVGYCLFRLGV